MTGSDNRAIDRWLTEILDLPPEGRDEALERVPVALRPTVEKLVEDALAEDDFLTPGAELRESLLTADLGDSELIGKLVGPYRVLSEIGAGGMGRVYLGERADGLFERQVAIKVVHLDASLTDRETLLRELRILAGLDHPGIAQLHDAGLTEEGDPFIVMEHVAGRRIDRYCEEEGPSSRRRLQLLIDVCDAVQAAHQRLIVHRDLKPSNILVDGQGAVKLLDFGIASLLDATVTDEDPHPRTPTPAAAQSPELQQGETHRRSWFTPIYASPEQRRGEPVTTASDVYQLGLLAQQLFGSPPSDESPRGSTMESASGGSTGTDSLGSLDRGLPGEDLRAVLTKALAPDADQRYPSADRLREDLSNLVTGRPVAARDSTTLYRMSRFLGRHRLSAAATLLTLLTLVTLSIGFTWRLADERDATQRQAEAAERAAAETQQVLDYLTTIFQTVNPLSSLNPGGSIQETTALELLDRSTDRLDRSFSDRPLVRARLLNVLGGVYRSLGADEQAEALLVEGLKLRENHPAVTPKELAESRLALGRMREQQGDYEEALELIEQAIAAYRAADKPKRLASALQVLAMVQSREANDTEALETLAEAGALWRETGQIDREAEVLVDRGNSLVALGRLDEGREALEKSIEILAEERGSGHLTQIVSRVSLANLYTETGELDKVIETLLPARELLVDTLGPDDFRLAVIDNNLGVGYIQSGRPAEARVHLEQALAIYDARQPNHPDVGEILNNLGTIEWALERPKEAEGYYRRALDVLRRTHTDEHPAVFRTVFNLGEALYGQADLVGAQKELDYSLELFESRLGREHPLVSVPLLYLAQIADQHGDEKKAEELFERTLRIRRTAGDPDFLEEAETAEKVFRAKRRDSS